MERRLIVVLVMFVAAVAVVGLSAGATMSSRGSARPTADVPASAAGTAARGTKPAASGKRTSSSEPVAESGPSRQKLSDVESYWTKERMEGTTPMAKSRDAITQSPSPAPSGKSAPGSTARKGAAATKSTKRTRTASADDVVTSPSKGDAASYWTEEEMDDAGPMDMTRPGPGPSGAPDTPPPGSIAPGTAP